MPSGRSNLIFNIGSNFKLNRGWSAFVNFNLFNNVRVEEENGRVSSQNINMIDGITKSFDIPQPRLKYHDIKGLCFNDQDENHLFDKGEKPISNILITINRQDDSIKTDRVDFAQTELLTNSEGEVCYNNMPEGCICLK